ncbi:hypothetical protein GCM10020229_39620 [Kitasatospora albolonga]|uniref:DUF3291 domain-containing protein n=1 Tax=Kitasatospora albolonga TaxID=68173 RepID=UPI0031E7EE44
MPQLALYTFGVLKLPLADPGTLTRELYESGESVYREITRQPGYLGHAEPVAGGPGELFGADWGVWGEFAVPGWYRKGRTAESTALAATLSLWTDEDAAFEAVYGGLHREALSRRHDWFERSAYPTHVMWWATDGAVPTWGDGASRMERLHEHGVTADGFTFRHPFAPEGKRPGS